MIEGEELLLVQGLEELVDEKWIAERFVYDERRQVCRAFGGQAQGVGHQSTYVFRLEPCQRKSLVRDPACCRLIQHLVQRVRPVDLVVSVGADEQQV